MTDRNSDPKPPLTPAQKWRRRAFIVGAVLMVVCKSVPEEYRHVCDTLATICTAGLG